MCGIRPPPHVSMMAGFCLGQQQRAAEAANRLSAASPARTVVNRKTQIPAVTRDQQKQEGAQE